MSMSPLSVSLSELGAFSGALSTAGSELAGITALRQAASTALVLPTLGALASEYAAAYEAAFTAQEGAAAAIIARLEDGAARALQTAASYETTDGASAAELGMENVTC